jgi:SAM-dependent methyltransferase
VRVVFDSKEKVSVYCDRRYSTWAQRGISGKERQLLTSLLDELPRSGRVLDLASGYGRFTPLLLPRTDCLLSLDLSHHMLVKAVERTTDVGAELVEQGLAARAGANFFVGANSSQLPLPDKCVDFSLTIRHYHHVHDRERRIAMLGELNRVTRRRIILTFYRSGTFHHAQRWVKKVKPMMKQITFRSIDQFLEETGEAGLGVERIIKLARMIHSQTFAVLRPS